MSTALDPKDVGGAVPYALREGVQPNLPRRISVRLAWLTTFLIMVAEIVVFIPSVANFWKEALDHKLETVAVASFATGRAQNDDSEPLTSAEEHELLRALGAELIAVSANGASRLLARAADVGVVEETIDLSNTTHVGVIQKAFGMLTAASPRTLQVVGPIGDGSMRGELILNDGALRGEMIAYARYVLLLSLLIASFAGILVNLAINWQLLRPVRRMTQSMIGFAKDPEDPQHILSPSLRNDEIGIAEAELARMQKTLAETLRRQRRLADLGLAVAKINHDLRNTLASAQLVSDRLLDLPDPQVQRFTPLLIRSLDRALSYTQSVLAYGQAVEERPVRRAVRLCTLVSEVIDAEHRSPGDGVTLVNDVPPAFEVDIDPDQFHRVLGNLVRNALEAFAEDANGTLEPRIRIAATAYGDGSALILVEDTGPGLPARARQSLFQAFRGSTRASGTGLGLAIVDEIVRAHGGRIVLAEHETPGARFEILLPHSTARLKAELG